MKSAVLKAKLGRDEGMQVLKRLDSQARQLEAKAEGPPLESFIAIERPAAWMVDWCWLGKRSGEQKSCPPRVVARRCRNARSDAARARVRRLAWRHGYPDTLPSPSPIWRPLMAGRLTSLARRTEARPMEPFR
jgi:hypothetical protein